MTAFDKCFLFLDSPRGGNDQLDKMKAAGFAGVFCNVRDYAPHEWEVDHLPRARVLGMFFGPWGRTGKGLSDRVWAPEVLKLIVDTADRWGSPLVVNSEKEIDATGATCTKEIAAVVGQRDAAISTEARLYDAVDWMPVAHLPCLNQIFPVESDWAHNPAGCKALAHKRGFRCAYFTFGAYGGMKPGDFDLKAPYSVYTADPIGPENYGQWSPTSTGFVGCPPVPAPPPPNPGGNVTSWYEHAYKKGAAVGPAHLPRELKPPDDGSETYTGDDVTAIKRCVSHGQRWLPWAPSQWDAVYNTAFAMGRGGGKVATSGVRGFQRQEGLPQTGTVDDATYQRIRRALIPVGPREGSHILDAQSIALINSAAKELSPEGKLLKIRSAIADFCERAEEAEELWHYTQQRPYTGLSVDPERNHENDCSSYVILAYWWARKATGALVPDPSGYRYTGYGNSWDDLDGHQRITSGNYLVGDLAHYDGHVTICRKLGNASTSVWSSFGQESGPEPLTLYYRPDFVKVVRPQLVP